MTPCTSPFRLIAAALLCLGLGAEAAHAVEALPVNPVPATTDNPRYQKALQELNGVLSGTQRWPFDDLEKLGWRLMPRGGANTTWPVEYLVVKKRDLYAVIVTPGVKSNRMSRFGVPSYDYPPNQPRPVFLLANIPKGYWPVNGCYKTSEWAEVNQRCEASKGEDCSFHKPKEEMIVFAKMPSACAQSSTLLHSAYRYVATPTPALVPVPLPAEGRECVVEAFRAKHCPELFQD